MTLTRPSFSANHTHFFETVFIEIVHAVWLEVCRVELYENQQLVPDIAHFMTQKGFALKLDFVNNIYGDQLWLNAKLAPADQG